MLPYEFKVQGFKNYNSSFPVLAKSKVTIKCGEPDKLKLEADVPQPKEKVFNAQNRIQFPNTFTIYVTSFT